jgi:hypothetical protein
LNQPISERLFYKDGFHSPRDLEDIFRIDEQGSVSQNFGERRCIGSQHGRSVGHRLERRQSKALIERGEGEQGRRLVKHPQNWIRDETKKPNILLHSAANYREAQVLVPAQLIADDDQFEVAISVVSHEFVLQDGKRFDKAVHVLVRPDSARIEDKRIVELVSLQYLPAIFPAGIAREALVERVVDDRDSIRFQIEKVDQVIPGGI